jgi:hypothetical protein
MNWLWLEVVAVEKGTNPLMSCRASALPAADAAGLKACTT